VAHAVVKTELLIQRVKEFFSIPSCMSSHELIKISKNGNDLGLLMIIDEFLNDGTLTSFTGRIGQGITLLIAHRLGYS
jgi:hypothetical protein